MTKTRNMLLAIMTVGSSAALLIVLGGYWQPIFWAVIFAILLQPVMGWFARRWPGHPVASANLIILGILALLLVTVFLMGATIVHQGMSIYAQIQSGAIGSDSITTWANGFYQTGLGHWLAGVGLDLPTVSAKVQPMLAKAESLALSLAAGIGMDTGGWIMSLMLMLYLLFLFLSEGPAIYKGLFNAIPMPEAEKQGFFQLFADVSTATILGTYAVGLAQGALGAGMFAILGVSNALFWGNLMVFLSLLPAVGSAIVWFPAALILMVTGSLAKGAILLAFGAVVISNVDGMIRPKIVGKKTQLPGYLVLLSTLGGIGTFGISGFVVGPVIAAFCIASWQMVDADHF